MLKGYERAKQIVKACNPLIKGGMECCYIRRGAKDRGYKDWIIMPSPEDFAGLDEYWNVLFHELIHWVVYGYQRLNRTDRSHEELIADIGASILLEQCGIPRTRTIEETEVGFEESALVAESAVYWINQRLSAVELDMD